jgi:hypothetical protein
VPLLETGNRTGLDREDTAGGGVFYTQPETADSATGDRRGDRDGPPRDTTEPDTVGFGVPDLWDGSGPDGPVLDVLHAPLFDVPPLNGLGVPEHVRPVRPVGDPLPWDDLADAYERLAAAERHGSADDVTSARADVARAREHLGALGNLLLLMALDTMALPIQKRLADVFDGLNRDAWNKAVRAGKRATWAIDQLDALKERVRELEAIVSKTASVGDPALTPAPRGTVSGGARLR